MLRLRLRRAGVIKAVARIIGYGLLAALVLLAVATAVLYTPSLSREAAVARYAAPGSRFLDLGEAGVAHVRVQGAAAAPPVVLLHGSNANLFTWQPWSDHLDGIRLITLDLPAHGLTGATPAGDYSRAGAVDFVAAVLDRLGVERAVIGGNSRGGAVAAAFAAQFPERVAGLLLVDASGLYTQAYLDSQEGGDDPALIYRLVTLPGVRHLITRLTPKFLIRDGLESAVVDPAVMTPERVTRYYDMIRMAGTRRATLARFGGALPPAVDADRLTMPTLIQWGAQDQFIPVSLAHLWHARLADSRLAIYERVGHLPMIEIPARSAADVQAFLDEIGWVAPRPAGATPGTAPAPLDEAEAARSGQ
ncbi:hypothetical protein CKO24_11225 [Rhodothalassium salexigens DSM 2132]|nr:hypothetical protein [Rhodothalassium salexigens DSM 2132]